MDVERSSLCNCVVNFLLEENYLLTAFELLHELLDDGRDAQAIRLKEYFSDATHFPPDQISRFNNLRVADPQCLLEEKEAAEEKLAICEYELRLAEEDILRLKTELQKKTETFLDESSDLKPDVSVHRADFQRRKKDVTYSDMGPLKDVERQDLNCAVKEYLLLAGYRLTAMTFYEEVTDQNLDVWHNTPACVPDALRHYYYQYLSSTEEAAEEKIVMLQEKESLLKANEKMHHEMECLRKSKDLADGQITSLTKSLESLQKDMRDKENLVQNLKQTLDLQRKELNDCRADITSLKMHIEGSRSVMSLLAGDAGLEQSQTSERYKEEIKSLVMEIQNLKAKNANSIALESVYLEKESVPSEEKVVEIHECRSSLSGPDQTASSALEEDAQSEAVTTQGLLSSYSSDNYTLENGHTFSRETNEQPSSEDNKPPLISDNSTEVPVPEKMGLGTIQILADALPKIVPYVLINHREELLPLIMCAIERHPDCRIRDSLTHTLFNLIKRPDDQQRRIIMDACVTLASNVGEMRTETELLPQCWEQINHMYEERRLLVAESCGELAEFVRPEIRDSLILSIVQQLVEDAATVVREAAAHNLALLLPLFPNMDKYFKVEELVFQLVCDPSGVVADTTLKKLLPAVLAWGNKLDNVQRVLLAHISGFSQRCPPLSGVEGSAEAHLRVLGERERRNIDVLLRMLVELLPYIVQKATETCPFPSVSERTELIFSKSTLELYSRGQVEWTAFEWMHVDCFPDLIQLACLLPQKEDNLRKQITKVLLAVAECFGDYYLTHMMLQVFLTAVGDDAELTLFHPTIRSRIKGLKPKTAVNERLARMCPSTFSGWSFRCSKHARTIRGILEEALNSTVIKGKPAH